MKAVLQRVARARVTVDGVETGSIASGILILLGVMRGDRSDEALALADKVAGFRMFADQEGRMNRSALEVGAGVLVVSQFTLAADGRKGRRPSFDRAAPPAEAEPLYELFARALADRGLAVAKGRFGAHMQVELVNDGPVTFVLEEPSPPAPSSEDAAPDRRPRA